MQITLDPCLPKAVSVSEATRQCEDGRDVVAVGEVVMNNEAIVIILRRCGGQAANSFTASQRTGQSVH